MALVLFVAVLPLAVPASESQHAGIDATFVVSRLNRSNGVCLLVASAVPLTAKLLRSQ